MEILFLILCGIGALALGVLGMKSGKDSQQVQQRMDILKQEQERPTSKLLRSKNLEKSFSERVLFPLAQNLSEKAQTIIPLTSKSWVRTKLIQAGYHKPQYPQVFLGIQLITSVSLFGVLLMIVTLFGKFGGIVGVIVAVFFGLAGYLLPMGWLLQQAKKRQSSIQKSLADFLDLLVICVEAGLGLDVAINKITNMTTNKTSAYLREELIRYTKDVAFGKPRKEAMLDMAARTGVDDLNTIINALVQAYDMGSSVAHTLRVQSETLRHKRLQKAEEKANKIPVKMVLPIYIFLFPAIFVTIMGPMAMVMIDSIMEIFANMDLGR